MNFKPFRDYSEHDVVNLFKLSNQTGSKATPVVISNSGWKTETSTPKVFANIAATYGVDSPNIYSPRWEIYPAVRPAVTGEKPLGLTLYDTKEVNQFNYPLLFDKQRREEAQAVLSGQAVPIVRKGLFLLGPFASGETPAPTKFVAVKGTGDIGVVPNNTGVNAAIVFGECFGYKDADGYALVSINCYL